VVLFGGNTHIYLCPALLIDLHFLNCYDLHPLSKYSNAWGMAGYFWMKRGDNMCGISDCASYPLVRDKPELDGNIYAVGEESMDADIVQGPSDDEQTIQSASLITSEVKASFAKWIELHQKPYQSEEEYQQRLLAYATNSDLVDRHNEAHSQGLTSYQMKMDGPFSDLTFAEFEDLYLMKKRDCYPTHTSSGPVPVDQSLELPKFHDWRTKGVITPIKAQGGTADHAGPLRRREQLKPITALQKCLIALSGLVWRSSSS